MNLKTKGQFAPDRVGRMAENPIFNRLCFLIVFFLTLIYSVSSNAQTAQLKTWVVGDRMYSFPSQPASGPPVVVRIFDSIPHPYNWGPRSVGSVNVITDEAGNVLFYVRNKVVYDSWDHEVLDDFGEHLIQHPVPPIPYIISSDIAITPYIEKDSCVKRYYFSFIQFQGNSMSLVVIQLSVDLSTKQVTAKRLIRSPGTIGHDLLAIGGGRFLSDGNKHQAGGQAVSPLKDGKRYLYYNSGAGNVKQTFFAPDSAHPRGYINSTNNGAKYIFDYNQPSYKFYCSQLTLSNDAKTLVWGNNPDENPVVNGSKYYCMELDSNGDWDGNPIQTFTLPVALTGWSLYGCRGVAFNSDKTKIFATTGKIGYGIYAIDRATGAYRLLPSSLDAGVSQLRVGNNGLLYALSRTELKAYDMVTETLVWQDSVRTHDAFDTIQYLPNFTNGEDVSSMPSSGIPVTVGSTTTFDGAVIGNMKIHKVLAVTNAGTELTIKNMTMEFSEKAALILNPGTKLILENCTLKAMDDSICFNNNKMWRGIIATSSDPNKKIDIVTTPMGTGTVTIRDAEYGIAASGEHVDISLLRKTTFIANETHLFLGNHAKVGNSEYNTFVGDEILRDQTKGDSNGYPDGFRRTKYGLYVSGADIDVGFQAVFSGGQYGVYAISPTGGTIAGSSFTWQKRSGVFLSNINSLSAAILIGNNWFGYVNNGVRIQRSNSTKFAITQNTFDHVSYNGVDVSNTTNCEYYIGYDALAPGSGSTGTRNIFTNSGAAAIYMYNNPGPNAKIYIGHNIITAAQAASHGIIVSENSGGQRKYSQLLIKNNTINNAERGIQLRNAVGANPRNPTKARLIQYPLSQIVQNTVFLHGNSGSNGIEASASGGHSLLKNSMNGNRYGIGANLTNSTATLYNENISSTGYGLMAQGYMFGSNYYCNQFDKANYGMYLFNHILRSNSGDVHGDSVTGARDNIFGTKPNSKPEYNICLDATNHVWNRWAFSTAWGIPAINSLTGGSTALFSSFEFNNCGEPLTPGGDPPPAMISDLQGDNEIFWDRYTNQQQYKMGYDSIGTNDSNVIRLIDAEDYIATGNFSAALGRINAIVISPFAPDELIMTDYKKLYSTYLIYRMQDTIGRNMNDSMVAILNEIALKNPVTLSPASHVAQAILYDERGLMFNHTPATPLVLSGYLSSSCAFPSKDGIPVYLLNQAGEAVAGPVYTDVDGQFTFDVSVVEAYTGVLAPFRMRMILTDGTIVESMAASVDELAKFGEHEFDCLSATGPYNVSGQINPLTCPGEVTSTIIIYLVKQSGEVIDGPMLAGPSGTFVFNPNITALHHNTYQYKIRLLFPDATMIEIPAESMADLAANSPYYFNCPETPPVFQGKKGDSGERSKHAETISGSGEASEFHISPNPSNGIFTISGFVTRATVTFTNLLGQVVAKDLPLLNGKVDASQLKPGIYILTVSTNEKRYVQKVNIIK